MTATATRALGIDVGSTTVKLVGVDDGGELLWHLIEATEPRIQGQVERLLAECREAGRCRAGAALIATGYGRKLVAAADRRVTEVTCHARGAYRAVGHGGTLVDIGGQDSKVIEIGPKGDVVNFAMNDKCAAGTGRFLENAARRLGCEIDDIGPLALSTTEEMPISSTCAVFAESEVVSLIAQGAELETIVRGLHRSLVRRLAAMVRMTSDAEPVMLSGGVARNAAIQRLLGDELGTQIVLPPHPQLMGAYGAALVALPAV